MAGHQHAAAIPTWISPERFEPYLRHAGHDHDKACELYEWAAELTSAAFQAIHYVEVMLRNAIDIQLQARRKEDQSRIPWFLTPLGSDKKSQDAIDRAVEVVRGRLRRENQRKDTRAQIIAGLSFGFWADLLGTRHEDLWRTAIRKAFPHSSGRRGDVATTVVKLRTFRNKLAHHDSLLAEDVPFRINQMVTVAGWIDPDAATWLRSTERATAIHAQRPVARKDTVVVAGTKAWPLYQQVHAYVCQAGRAFQPVEHLAFYAGQAIQPEITAIRQRIDNVDWTPAESRRRRATGDPQEIRIADVIDQSITDGWTDGRYQVFLLSSPGDPDHHTRSSTIPHAPPPGRGQAFTQSQRYAVRQKLIDASSTSDLS